MKTFTLLIFCFLAFSCKNESLKLANHNQSQKEITAPKTMQPPPPPISSEHSLIQSRKIIKKGNIDFEVTDLEHSKYQIDSTLKSVQGYYVKEQFNSYNGKNYYSLKLRVPASNFDSIVKSLDRGVGKIIAKNINAKDFTEEYVDLKIRLDNNLDYLNQYKAVLKRAKSVKEILQVKEKIRNIEEEIESKKGRIKYLDDLSSFSTLDIELSQKIEATVKLGPTFGSRLSKAFKNGIEVFLSFTIFLINLWPFILIVTFLFIVKNRIYKIFTRRKERL